MNESGKFEVQKKKLQGICDEHNLVFSFRKDKYPITLTVKTTGDIQGQMSMLIEAEDDGYRSPDARLIFSMRDGELVYHMSETFTISDTLFNKLKNIFKNMHSLWLQFFFRDVIENETLTDQQMPAIDDDKDDGDIADDTFDELQDAMEPLETFEDDEEDSEDGADPDEEDGEENSDHECDDPADEAEA